MIRYIIFYSSIAFILYVYLGYPVILWLWRRVASRRVHKSTRMRRGNPGAYEPSVSIIVAAYNEDASIERKILNLLALDYPARKVQIVLSLDGPTDDTEAVARQYETATMRVLLLKQHGGKAEALNQGVARATGDILVFADARQILDRTAVRELVSNFEGPSVGGVTGELMLLDEFGKQSRDAVGIYWRYEKQLRSMESDIHSTMGATGALYAIRRELYRPIPSHTILDDVAIPMNAVLAGKRIVFDRAARVYDRGASSPEAEFTRRVRTLTGNFQLLTQMPALIAPWRNPVFIQFISHKVGRLFVPYFLIALLASNLFLDGAAYRGILILQSAWYILAGTGAVLTARQYFTQERRDDRRRTLGSLFLFPYTFVVMNWAAVVGLYYFLRKQPGVWSGYDENSLLKQVPLHDSASGHESELSDAA